MSDLNILLRRLNQRTSNLEAAHLEDAATATLVGVLALITLAVLF